MKNEEQTLEQMISMQTTKLLRIANQINPRVTEEDILQPNDFPELENHPYFRYEEGALHGMQSALAAIKAIHSEVDFASSSV